MAEGDGRREAREFLAGFLAQLRSLDQTTRLSVEVQNRTLQSLSLLVGQVDSLARRLDSLDRQIAQLSAILARDGDPNGALAQAGEQARARVPLPSLGQALGGALGFGVDQLLAPRQRRR